MQYYVEIQDENFNNDYHTDLLLTPIRFSKSAVGGPEYAEIAIAGTVESLWQSLNMLRYPVIIRDAEYNVVWHGFISEASVDLGGITIGTSLNELANRVRLFYSYNNAEGKAVSANTNWIEDEESILRYGEFDYIESLSDLNAETTFSYIADLLGTYANPIPVVEFRNTEIKGSLVCKGWWTSLAYKIFNYDFGFEEYDSTGDYEHLLGFGFTGTDIGFSENEDRLHSLSSKLAPLDEDDFIIVSGATETANNGQFRVKKATSYKPESYTATTISFDPADDVLDSAEGFAFIEADEYILISGSAEGANNRYFLTKSDMEDGHIAVSPGEIEESVAGSSVTIAQGHSIELDAELEAEFPSASITVQNLGIKVAQSFTLPVDEEFTLAELYIRARREGNVTDELKVSIFSDSSGSPGSSLATAEIEGSDMGNSMLWRRFDFDYSLSYGVTYWIVVERTGSFSATNYYLIDLNSDALYPDGALKLFNGSTWVTRTPTESISAVDMPFKLWASQETSVQISNMLEECGQFLTDYEIRTASGLTSRQFRDGNNSAQYEIEKLMAVGTDNGKRYVSNVTVERMAQIFEEPSSDIDRDYMLNVNGTIQDASGTRVPVSRTPVGKWIHIVGLPTGVDHLSKLSPVFIERIEIDCELDKISAFEFRGTPSPWKVTYN